MSYDSRHGLAYRVERVHFVQLVLGTRGTDTLVVLTEVKHESEQCTLRLVADLLRQVALSFARLTSAITRTHRYLARSAKLPTGFH